MHLGLLRIEGDPLTGLRWIPRSAELKLDLGEDVAALRDLTDVHVVEAATPRESATVSETSSDTGEKSTRVDFSPAQGRINEPLQRALVEAGCTQAEASRRLEAAWKHFEGSTVPPTEGELLYHAFRA